MDDRMRRVLLKLAHHQSPTTAAELFTVHDAPSGVVSGQLKAARALGLCTMITFKSNKHLWVITEAGRAALAESK